MTTHIKYLSRLPGAGKTHYVIHELIKIIEDKSCYGLYVAPTIDLLDQVLKSIENIDAERGTSYLKHIQKIVGDTSGIDPESRSNVTARIILALNGGRNSNGALKRGMKFGDVLFITHQSFLMLPALPKSENTRLFFDEARKCVVQRKTLQFTNKYAVAALTSSLNLKPFESNPSYLEASLLPGDTANDAWKRVQQFSSSTSEAASKNRSAIKRLIETAANPRVTLFLKPTKVFQTCAVIEVLLPTQLFSGFESVTLLSAFFETSQMFRLLENQKGIMLHELRSDTTDPYGKLDRTIDRNLRYRELKIRERYGKTAIVPLTATNVALSKSLMNGLFVAESQYLEVSNLLKDYDLSTSADFSRLRTYLTTKGNAPSTTDQALLKELRQLGKGKRILEPEPFDWYLRKAKRVVELHEDFLKVGINKPLCITNAATGFVKKAKKCFGPKWKYLSTSSHGLNGYKKSNVVVFIAAVNPSPEMLRFYKTYLPEYKPEEDHVADAVMQGVCRCSVRDTDNKNPVLVIVPDSKIAKLLREKMDDLPSIRSDLVPKPRMVSITARSTVSTRGKPTRPYAPRNSGLAKSNKEHQAAWKKSNPLNPKIASMRARISYFKKRVNELEDFDKVKKDLAEIEIQELQKELKELLIKRDEWKKQNA